MFAPTSRRDFDYDHALGRALARSLGLTYVLLVRVPKTVNRAHGRFERPVPRTGLNLQKTVQADARILRKVLGLKWPIPSEPAPLGGRSTHDAMLDEHQLESWVFALGLDPSRGAIRGLTRITR